MKTQTFVLSLALLGSSLFSTHAQMGGSPGPRMNGSMAKLFGQNSAFSADSEMQMKDSSGETMTLPGKMAFDSGKSRFEMNMSEAKGSKMPPDAAAQMKKMGMDQMVSISRPDKKVAYVVYPTLKAYAEITVNDPDAGKPDSAFKIETTELGKETVDDHACVKNKVIITDDKGEKHESTVWNATDLKKFPVKIENSEQGATSVMLFKNVKLAKPDAAKFEPPADFKKYNSPMELMQTEMMKNMK
jgi:hypothetical protein